MTTHNTLPTLSSDSGLSKYLQEIQKFPMLSEQEEYDLAIRCRDHADIEAAQVLVTSHLRYVATIALKYKNYGLPITDLIAEGNLGLMHAVKKFKPEMGFRLSTYALWWIKASIQDYILKSWSMVKIGTSAAQKKLFFNLNKVKNKLLHMHQGETNYDENKLISEELSVSVQEVKDMDNKMNTPVFSLNNTPKDDSESEFLDIVIDESANQENTVLENNERSHRVSLMNKAMSNLNEREKDIINSRILQEKPITLDVLSQKYNVSRERIRQIENNALNKLKKSVHNN